MFIHCGAGVSRAATCTLACLCELEGWPLKTSIGYLKVIRPCINPNVTFRRLLEEKYNNLNNSAMTNGGVGIALDVGGSSSSNQNYHVLGEPTSRDGGARTSAGERRNGSGSSISSSSTTCSRPIFLGSNATRPAETFIVRSRNKDTKEDGDNNYANDMKQDGDMIKVDIMGKSKPVAQEEVLAEDDEI